MFQAIGRVLSLILGFIFWGVMVLIVGALLLGSFWLDGVGVEKEAVVASKEERISFNYASWTRTLEAGLQREDGPMAEIRRRMRERKDGHPDLVGVEKVRVSSSIYDGLRVGQTVKVRVQPPGFFKEWRIFPQVRLAGQTTASIAYSLYESAWPVPEFLLSLAPMALLGWLATRTSKWLWAASAACLLVAMAYWLSPLSDRRPSGVLAEASGKVVALRLVDEIGATSESEGVDALVPHLIVGVEFTPEGGNAPVVAVDRVDASSVDLKEGSAVRVEYQRDDPRRALLLNGERRWWWMNFVSLGQYGAIAGGLILACLLVARFFKGLLASRRGSV